MYTSSMNVYTYVQSETALVYISLFSYTCVQYTFYYKKKNEFVHRHTFESTRHVSSIIVYKNVVAKCTCMICMCTVV